MVYLDNAATTFPKPRDVVTEVARAMMFFGANPGRSAHSLSLRAAREAWQCREALAKLLNAPDPARIVFCLNCTDALNIAVQGSLHPGMHVITTALEHNSVIRQLAHLNTSGAIRLTILQPNESGTVSAEQFARAFTPDAGLAICTHASNVTGVIQPIAEIGAVCRKKGVRFIIDAAQTAGIIPLDVQAIGCDMAAMPGHKGLYGPMGTGALYIADGVNIAPLRRGGTGSSSQSVYQPDDMPERLESGTLNLPGIVGLRAGIEFVAQRGREARIAEQALVETLIAGLNAIPQARIIGPQSASARVGVVSFNIGAIPSTYIADELNRRGIAVRAGLHCAPLAHEHYGTLEQGAVRASLSAFNVEKDISDFLNALELIVSKNSAT